MPGYLVDHMNSHYFDISTCFRLLLIPINSNKTMVALNARYALAKDLLFNGYIKA